MSDYYTVTGNPATRAAGSSAAMRAEFQRVDDAFDLLPGLSGNGDKLVTINNGGTAQSARTLAGTANQITVTVAAGTITLSLPSAVTLPGTLTVTGAATLPSVKTGGTTASVPNNTATTLFSAGTGLYLVQAYIGSGAAADYTAYAVFMSTGGSDMRKIAGVNGTNLTLAASGADIQVTQTSGSTNNVAWASLRVVQ